MHTQKDGSISSVNCIEKQDDDEAKKTIKLVVQTDHAKGRKKEPTILSQYVRLLFTVSVQCFCLSFHPLTLCLRVGVCASLSLLNMNTLKSKKRNQVVIVVRLHERTKTKRLYSAITLFSGFVHSFKPSLLNSVRRRKALAPCICRKVP